MRTIESAAASATRRVCVLRPHVFVRSMTRTRQVRAPLASSSKLTGAGLLLNGWLAIVATTCLVWLGGHAGWRVRPEYGDEQAGGHVMLCCHPSSMQGMLVSQKALGKELMRAVAVGETARVQELIASGADVETRNPEVGFMSTLPFKICGLLCCAL